MTRNWQAKKYAGRSSGILQGDMNNPAYCEIGALKTMPTLMGLITVVFGIVEARLVRSPVGAPFLVKVRYREMDIQGFSQTAALSRFHQMLHHP